MVDIVEERDTLKVKVINAEVPEWLKGLVL